MSTSTGKEKAKMWLLGLLFLVVGTCVAGLCGKESGEDVKGPYSVCKECQTKMEGMLKAPGTADFPSCFSAEIREYKGEEGHFLYNSYVDAQNGFGALIRTTYICDTRFKDGSWSTEISTY